MRCVATALSACAILMCSSASARTAVPQFIGLTSYTQAVGMSDDLGVLVSSSPFQRAALWRFDGSAVSLDLTQPSRLAANGLVAVGNGQSLATRLVLPNAWERLPPPPGGSSTSNVAESLSGDGSVVVGTENSVHRAWYWSAAGGTQYVPVAGTSNADDVSRDGQRVLGRVGDQGYVCNVITGATSLVSPQPGRQAAEMRRISGDGNFIVGYQIQGGSSGQVGEAFRWTSEGGVQFLPPIPGPLGTTPYAFQSYRPDAISFDGSVVAGTQGGRAWIWSPALGTRDLKDLLSQTLHLTLDGWNLISVSGISPDGQTLCGYGELNGASKAFVAVIPGPGGALLWLGVPVLAMRRLRRRASDVSMPPPRRGMLRECSDGGMS